jgi:tRNA-(ms[2]io[6]A)-hydroxylase
VRSTAAATRGPILAAPTDRRWFDFAVERWHELLLDHANCEKKAASTALSLMFAYPEDYELADRMSRLAREELRHFELVQQKLRQLQVPFRRMSPSRYAEGLRKALRRAEPERRIDLLLTGALIEARSHERFAGLIPRLGEPFALAKFVLRDKPEWTDDKIRAAMKGTEPRTVVLEHPIPVLIVYATSMAREDGRVFFYQDIYQHDAKLDQLLKAGYN